MAAAGGFLSFARSGVGEISWWKSLLCLAGVGLANDFDKEMRIRAFSGAAPDVDSEEDDDMLFANIYVVYRSHQGNDRKK